MLDRTHGPAVGEPAIAIRGLSKRFAGRTVIAGLDLDIAYGDAVALIGSNGAGKSTLLRCMIRLTEPDGGAIRVMGQTVTGIDRGSLTRIRSQIGFVFQKHNLVTRLSVLSNVVHGAQSANPGPRNWLQCLATARTSSVRSNASIVSASPIAPCRRQARSRAASRSGSLSRAC